MKSTEKVAQLGKSQTADVTIESFGNEEWNLEIIDTPGLADTENRDPTLPEKIASQLTNNYEFNAICVLLKSGDNRTVTIIGYVINSIRAMMPKEFEGNFITIVTRSEHLSKDVLAVINNYSLPSDNVICIDNSPYEELVIQKSHANSLMHQTNNINREDKYYSNWKKLEKLLEHASNLPAKKSESFLNLKIKRDKAKSNLAKCAKLLKANEEKKQKITDVLEDIRRAQGDVDNNSGFNICKEIIDVKARKKDGKISTNCNACNKVCHIDCGLSFGDDLRNCSCMGSHNCCSNCGHGPESHCHLGWETYEEKRTVTEVDEHMKQRKLTAEERLASLTKQRLAWENEKTKAEKDGNELFQEIHDQFKELSTIALVGSNESIEQFIKDQIQEVTESKDLTTQQKEQKKQGYLEQWRVWTLEKAAIAGKKFKDFVWGDEPTKA